MKRIYLPVVFILMVSFAIYKLPSMDAGASADRQSTGSTPGIRIIDSTEQSITIEYIAGEPSISVLSPNAGADEDEHFHRIELADTVQQTEPGKVQVPVASTTLGIPANAELTLSLLEADSSELPGQFRLSASAEMTFNQALPDNLFNVEETALALGNEGIPEENSGLSVDSASNELHQLIQLGELSLLREQPIVQLLFYPVDYQPTSGKVTLYNRIRAQISWSASPVNAASVARVASPHFEPILEETLLNYALLKRANAQSVEAAASNSLGSAAAKQAAVADPTSLKIWTDQLGFYRLTYADLDAAGFDVSGDPQLWQMLNKGTEVAIQISGEGDGTFDPGDEIIFFAEEHDTDYSGENVYWLQIGVDSGLRMAEVDGSPEGSPAGPEHFLRTFHAEEDSTYWQTMPNGAGQEHWFWGDRLTAPITRTETITLTAPITGANATDLTAELRVQLKGRSDTESNPDHHTQIFFNDTLVDDHLWDGFALITQTATISQSLIADGPNTVTIISVGDTESAVDQLFLNWIELDYWRHFEASDEQLAFSVAESGPNAITVNGFTSDDLALFEMGDPSRIKHITSFVTETINADVTLRFTHAPATASHYLALARSRLMSPRVALDRPSELRSSTNGADYILIAPPEFITNTLPLATFREGQGLRVISVTTDDIYDEFSHGIFTPHAIQDFLTFAYENWVQPAPTYVLLAGDATLDYRDRLGTGSVNFVPSQLIETQVLGQTPSDNWFVQISGDDVLPDMLIGRLSVQSADQMDDVVQKIIDYETSPPSKDWSSRTLFVADDDSTSFTQTSDTLKAILPITYTVNQINLDEYEEGDDPAADINMRINDGAFLTNYTGHGAVERWGKWGKNLTIYQNDDIEALTNRDRLTIVTTANCLNGFFAGFQTSESLAEKFQRLPNGGAVAVWAPSNLFFPSAHRVLLQEFYEEFYQKRTTTLGAATTNAKIEAYARTTTWHELVEAFVLFGDPATSLDDVLPIPPTPTPTPTNTPTLLPANPLTTPTATPTSLPVETSTNPTGTPIASTPGGGTSEPLQTPSPSVEMTPTAEPGATQAVPTAAATTVGDQDNILFLPITVGEEVAAEKR